MDPKTRRIYQEIMDDFAEREAAISFPMIAAMMRGRGCQVSEQDVLVKESEDL